MLHLFEVPGSDQIKPNLDKQTWPELVVSVGQRLSSTGSVQYTTRGPLLLLR